MWDTIVINPMVNALLLFYDLLFNNFVLAIAVLTIVIRLITLPLNLRQQKTSLRMQTMQPEIQAIQKKYKDIVAATTCPGCAAPMGPKFGTTGMHCMAQCEDQKGEFLKERKAKNLTSPIAEEHF